ncbi:elongation factor 1-delta-like [Glandiceps talaboti]
MAHPLLHETIWFEKFRCADAERNYQEKLAQQHSGLVVQGASSSLVSEIARARKNIQNTLTNAGGTGLAVGLAVENNMVGELKSRLSAVEQENKDLKLVTQNLQNALTKLQSRVSTLEKSGTPAPPPKVEEEDDDEDEDDDDDDDIDLFGDDEEADAAAEKLKQERLQAYAEKKAKKGPGPVAKSSLVLDVKPWDDETDMKEIEKLVRDISTDGLVWGASKLVPVGYGIKKLQIGCVIEDDKVGTDFLEEEITKHEDLVQSMDVAAFNKI